MWDATYIFLRPHTFPGGKYHQPLFEPMVQWATVDHIYGEHGWLEKEGFTAAQGVINVLEVTLYMVYFGIAWQHGSGLKRNSFGGRSAAWAVLIGFGAGVVTATKTALYCTFAETVTNAHTLGNTDGCEVMREIFSEYKYTEHNSQHPVFTLWGFMNLLYTAASVYMIITFGRDILDGLSFPSEKDEKSGKKNR
ncbi:hypothetical protein N0V90_005909 [Kalmusia sp. IMI 367209]|nr:hypothetical protein N0V90_005909 [Kalmusia sp. IMI 367209]